LNPCSPIVNNSPKVLQQCLHITSAASINDITAQTSNTQIWKLEKDLTNNILNDIPTTRTEKVSVMIKTPTIHFKQKK